MWALVSGVVAGVDLGAKMESAWTTFVGEWHLWAAALGIIFAGFVLRKVLTEVVLRWLGALSRRSETEIDDRLIEAIRKPAGFGVVVAGLYCALSVLNLDPETFAICERAIGVLFFIFLAWVGLNLCDVVAFMVERLTAQTNSRLDDQLVPIVRKTLKVFVAFVSFILIVQNMGYSVSALVAGFSVGGAAVALASKDTLSNFFGSIMIFIDRPFQVGDWIEAGSLEGVVEEVGLRSTRIRTFAKTVITVPNSRIAHEPINNYSRMPKRRVVQTIGIGYNTEPERVQAVVHAFRKVLAESEQVDQDFWMVNFTEFADSALNIYLYFFTKTTVWSEYMGIRQDLNLTFMKILAELGVEIAFPTRTLYMRQDQEPEKPDLDSLVKYKVPVGFSPPAPAADDAEDDG